jgi:hypothetical protein
MAARKTFVVGGADRRAVTVVVVRCETPGGAVPPIRGPWTLKAVVSAN